MAEVSINCRATARPFFNGTLREGSADRIVARADATPGLRIMALNSTAAACSKPRSLRVPFAGLTRYVC